MKVFSSPIPAPKFDNVNWQADENKFFNDLKIHMQGMGYTGTLTGEIIRIPWADGAAVYMVADAPRKMCLIHCPVGDAWHVPDYMLRGMNKADVMLKITQRKAMRAMFGHKG